LKQLGDLERSFFLLLSVTSTLKAPHKAYKEGVTALHESWWFLTKLIKKLSLPSTNLDHQRNFYIVKRVEKGKS